MADHVFHFRHGWIPITAEAADVKSHGDKSAAHRLLVNAEVAKVAAGEKSAVNAKAAITHAHGTAGKDLGSLSPNQLKHEHQRARDMEKAATGPEEKAYAAKHLAAVKSALGSPSKPPTSKAHAADAPKAPVPHGEPQADDRLHVGTLEKYHGEATVIKKLDDRNAGHYAVRMESGPNKGKTARVAGNQLFTTKEAAVANKGSGSYYGGGLGDLGKLQKAMTEKKKPEHQVAHKQLKAPKKPIHELTDAELADSINKISSNPYMDAAKQKLLAERDRRMLKKEHVDAVKAKAAAPEGKKVVGAPEGYALFDTGNKGSDGDPVLELRDKSGKVIGTVEKRTGLTHIKSKVGNMSVGAKKYVRHRITPAGGPAMTSYEKTRQGAVAELLRRITKQ
jgi:hypothetical protein